MGLWLELDPPQPRNSPIKSTCQTGVLEIPSISRLRVQPLKKIVPNQVQLGDCRLERGDKEPFAITSQESIAIECLERMGNLEIKVDPEIFCEPGLDTRRDFACRWRRFCLVDELVCEHSFLAILVLGSGD